MGDETSSGNGRVTTREFYEELIKMRQEMGEMERRLLEAMSTLARAEDVKANREEIVDLKVAFAKSDKIWGTISGVAAVAVSAMMDFIYQRR